MEDITPSNQPLSGEIPLQAIDTEEPAPSELAEFPTEVVLAISAEAVTAATPVETPVDTASTPAEEPAPANPVPADAPAEAPTPAISPDYVVPSAATPGAPLMQPFPQAVPAQAYMPVGAIGYVGAPAFPPAPTGSLPQPGYPVAYAQEGYPPFPGQMQPVASAPVTQKRGRLILWTVLIIVVLLLLGGSNAVTYALSHPSTPKAVVKHVSQPQPNGTLQTYCQGIMAGNAEEIYNLLSDQAKIHTSLDDIQKMFDQFNLLNSSSNSMNVQYTNCTFNNIRVSGSLAVATVSLTITLTMQAVIQNQKQSQTVTETSASLSSLVWESNQWKIDFSQFTQPQPTFGFSVAGF